MAIKRQTLSPVDTAWLHMEEPTNLMMVTCVCLLEGTIDNERLHRTLEARLLTLDRFRMRVVECASASDYPIRKKIPPLTSTPMCITLPCPNPVTWPRSNDCWVTYPAAEPT